MKTAFQNLAKLDPNNFRILDSPLEEKTEHKIEAQMKRRIRIQTQMFIGSLNKTTNLSNFRKLLKIQVETKFENSE